MNDGLTGSSRRPDLPARISRRGPSPAAEDIDGARIELPHACTRPRPPQRHLTRRRAWYRQASCWRASASTSLYDRSVPEHQRIRSIARARHAERCPDGHRPRPLHAPVVLQLPCAAGSGLIGRAPGSASCDLVRSRQRPDRLGRHEAIKPASATTRRRSTSARPASSGARASAIEASRRRRLPVHAGGPRGAASNIEGGDRSAMRRVATPARHSDCCYATPPRRATPPTCET